MSDREEITCFKLDIHTLSKFISECLQREADMDADQVEKLF
jgi:hypothetical protein